MKKVLHRIFVDGFNGMALGLFATLIIGTAVEQIGIWIGGAAGAYLAAIGNIGKTLTGAGIGVGVAAKYQSGPLVTVSAAVAGMIGAFHNMSGISFGMSGEPLGAFVAAYIAIQIGQIVSGRTHFDIIITPTVSILTGALVGYFVGPYISKFIYWLGSLANYNVDRSPIIGGIIVSVLFGMFQTMPVNSLAMAVSLGLSGVAAGAATVGVCCNMVGFAVASYRENRAGGLIAQSMGTSMLQFPNILKRPLIWIPPIISSAILGPVSAALLHMTNTATGAGLGSLILIGQFTAWQSMVLGTPGAIVIIEIVLMHFLLPALLTLSISEVMRKLNWIRKGDMRLEV